jgi:uncharacterized tellurite resistance protein B-like protein
MIDAIRSFMTRKVAPASRVEPGRPAPEGVRVAACALLLELAHADGEFTAEEQAHIERAVAQHFGLDGETTQELLALANARRVESIDHFAFTRVINRDFDQAQKMVLAEVMWGVILADGQIGEHEQYLVRKIANLLELPPAYLAEARRAAKG